MQDSPAAVGMFNYRGDMTFTGPAGKSPKVCYSSFTVGASKSCVSLSRCAVPLNSALNASGSCSAFTKITHN